MCDSSSDVARQLSPEQADVDPFRQFERWFSEAVQHSGNLHPEAMHLSTVDGSGIVSGRIVLLKSADSRGFVFYTNLESAKSRALKEVSRAAVTFHWERLGRQVRVRGSVESVSDAEANEYFASRPRGSQVGAWASLQSQVLASRGELEDRVRGVVERFANGPVSRPPHWSGWRLVPDAIEFWQERDDRLHDRVLYRPVAHSGEPTEGLDRQWSKDRLYP